MVDLAKYVVRLEAQNAKYKKGLDDAQRKLEKFRNAQSRSLQAVGSQFAKLAGAAAGLVSVSAALSKTVEVGREFDTLNAQLITATGSIEGASSAFKVLEQFARNTPFALEQSVSAFVKLVNLGLTPSQRALESYGNTASAMGKDLSQFIEAVADAATAEFERLKEFGIKSKNQGDTIAFTFRGVTTEVGNNAREIEEFLIRLGEVEFAGAMQRRVDTLDGALSNLNDSWDGLFRTISNSSIGKLIEEQVRKASAALDGLSAKIRNSGRNATDVLKEIAQIEAEAAAAAASNGAGPRGQGLRNEASERRRTRLEALQRELQEFLDAPSSIQSTLETLQARLERLQNQGAAGRNRTTFEALAKETEADIALLQGLLQQAGGAEAATGGDPLAAFGKGAEVRAVTDVEEAAQKELFQALQELRTEDNANRLAEERALMDRIAEAEIENARRISAERETFANMFADNLIQASEFGFKAVLQGWVRTLQQMLARAAGTKLFEALFPQGLGGGGGGGGLLGAIGGLFGGARATGGPVAAGIGYLVGERGPEMFVPNTAGQIVPNGAMGGVNIHQNLTVNGASRAEMAAAAAIIQQQTRATVMDELRRTGRL